MAIGPVQLVVLLFHLPDLPTRHGRELVATYSPPGGAAQLQTLADLHDRGKLTDEEFAAEKARVLAARASAAT